MLRTHTCGELRADHCGQQVTLGGWAQSIRDHGGLLFITLRDRHGVTQVVVEPDAQAGLADRVSRLRRESVITVSGKVCMRPPGTVNPSLGTGEIEVYADKVEIVAESAPLPIEVSDDKVANEESRLKYRYLDLRRPSIQANLIARHRVAQAVRNCLSDQGFLEIQTPLLVRSTPEGARDFVVPSRHFAGKFYALPQSPQLYKQMLMISGLDRYFQLAPCFRDEDQRADRQLVHTQIDLEMSFCDESDVYRVVELTIKAAFSAGIGVDIEVPFRRMTYYEAVEKYGSDKPDLRFGMELKDLTGILSESEFSMFRDTARSGGRIRAICAKGCAGFTRREIDELTEYVKIHHAKGLVYMKVSEGALVSSISKYLTTEQAQGIMGMLGAEDGDLILIIADSVRVSANAMGQLRRHLGRKLGLARPNDFQFLWVTEFPLFDWNEEEGKWDSMHHIFTMPMIDDIPYLRSDPGKVRGRLYDLVLNGTELGSGSIRINRPDLQAEVMNIIGMSREEAESKFGFLLRAYEYGAPIHGGFAVGFDRLLATMLGLENLRDVIAFPQNAAGVSVVDDCPNYIDERQWRELHIKLRGND